MSHELDLRLKRIFEAYRRSFKDFNASPDFLPGIWRKIEERRSRGWLTPLSLWSPRLAAAAALATAILAASLWISERATEEAALLDETYLDALTVDSMDEHDGSLWLQAGNAR